MLSRQSPKTSCLTSSPVARLFVLLQPHCAVGSVSGAHQAGPTRGLCTCPVCGTLFPRMLSAPWQLLNEYWSKWVISLSCVTLGSYLRSWCPSNPQVQTEDNTGPLLSDRTLGKGSTQVPTTRTVSQICRMALWPENGTSLCFQQTNVPGS